MNFISTWLKKKWVLAIIGVIIVAGSYYGYKSVKAKGTSTRYVTSPVVKGTITSAVTGTGQVAASNQVDLKPGASGAITSVDVKQGDQVKAGQTIATIDSRAAAASLAQAQAGVAQAEANYQKAISGATGSDLTSAQNAVTSAQLNLDNTKVTTANNIANAKQSLDDATANLPTVEAQQQRNVTQAQTNYLNAGLTVVQSSLSNTAPVTLSGTYTGTAEGQYTVSFYESQGSDFQYSSTGLGSGGGTFYRGVNQPLGNGLYLNIGTSGTFDPSTIITINVPNKESSSYNSAYTSYQNALATQTQAIQDAQEAIPKAQSAYDQAQSQAQTQINSAQNQLTEAQQALTDKLSPADRATVLTAAASVKQAEASLVNAQTNYANTTVTVPFDGVVATLSAQKGDQASPSTAIATITTTQDVAQITLNEVDVAKVKVGQKATLTFSAIDGLSVSGEVAQVDLIGTVTQNVVSYKAQVLFDTQDDRVKPGMSVSVDVITDVKQDVLTVPSAAVKTDNNGSYVETLVNGAPVQHTVTTGLSNDTDTEVSGDIKEGDQVITQTIVTGGATTKTGTQPNSLLQSLGGARAGGTGAAGRTGTGGFTGGFGGAAAGGAAAGR